MNTKIKLYVQGLSNSQIQSGAYALILAEEIGPRRIPIIVGTAEAQSIAIAIEQITPPRPLTHDLFASFSQAFGVVLKEVFIYKFEDGIFYSELFFSDGEQEIRLDSRTSDAIAIALRVKCEIYTTEQIVRECGVVLEESTERTTEDETEEDELGDIVDSYLSTLELEDLEDEKEIQHWLRALNDDELHVRLEEAISQENYEHAQIYKEELKKREEGDRLL
ncbi:bifunctional nuclease family protein [Parabacteroides sp. 52]|uniref:bifunctional nuclease family protein n=1 Tax=unclassified Parabacteroides TaxID=2649774 RepID=UPI0013D5E759|nr:bifunctional nuclease family protein [Parabacteroides sp. PM5-20]MDH6534031.1 bifunctional DNase/RNase [Parabacteroides sp. PM5-20]NDV54773.1 bifunctional nuclease family protein [Parabacteroides sp. 52]